MPCNYAPDSKRPNTGASTWTMDLCANMVMGALHFRRNLINRFDGGSDEGTFLQTRHNERLYYGDWYPCSLHAVRAEEWRRPIDWEHGQIAHAEACRFHIARIGVWGDWMPVSCHLPDGSMESAQSVLASILPASDRLGETLSELGIALGDWVIRLAYQTPIWVEVGFWSNPACCGVPI